MWSDPAHRTLVSRGILKEYDATGGQHVARISGLKGEELAGVPRLQQWGQSGHPPIGSHVLFARMGGASDRAVILGIDHADYAPKDLAAGHKAIYDQAGNIVKMTGAAMRIGAVGTLTLEAGSSIVLKAGGVTVTISGSGVAVTGGSITHDGKDIGKTHKHGGVTSGASLTGVPA